MTGTQLAARIRFDTKTTSATLADSDLLPIVNFSKDEIATMITEKDENYFIVPGNFDLIASSATAREYSLSDSQLNNLVSVQLAFDSTQSPLAYVIAEAISMHQAMKETGGLTEANITNTYDNLHPKYFVFRRSIFILSAAITPVTNGGLIHFRAFPADLANLTGISDLSTDPTTTTFGMPKVFHELWARRCVIHVKQSRPKPIQLNELDKKWDDDMTMRLSEIRRKNLSEEEFGALPTTSREGVNGFNL